MTTTLQRLLVPALVAGRLSVAPVWAEEPKPTEVIAYGALATPPLEALRSQAAHWLSGLGADDARQAKLLAIWADGDRPAMDRLLETFSLDPVAAKALADARDPASPAPKELPAILRDSKAGFFRSNFALVYARALSNKRVYEEALEALKSAVPEQVADPAAYYFTRAVAEHALVQKREALSSIVRLLDDVKESPERYKMVAALMYLDMQNWKDDDKDLQNISRLMTNIERRLDLARHGDKTQAIQKKVLFRLDEMIKEVENQVKNNGQPAPCPAGGPPEKGNTNQPSSPQQDSVGGNNSGPGNVDQKKLQQLAQNWGKLPEKERARAMMELTKDLPPRYREVIEQYFKTLAKSQESR